MLSGQLYDAADPVLYAERMAAAEFLERYNQTPAKDRDGRSAMLRGFLGKTGDNITIEPSFKFDYGYNIEVGENFFANYNCVFLDVMPIKIGSNVLMGPAVQIYTATHPLDPETRRTWLENAKPITIGDDVWIGGGAIICPGVTIGSGVTIGAGSVVTRDIPDRVFAAGNPCRVITSV